MPSYTSDPSPCDQLTCYNGGSCEVMFSTGDPFCLCPGAFAGLQCQDDCNLDEFTCREECINLDKRCDGNDDCAYGEDEQNCYPDCGGYQFSCAEKCINIAHVCNGNEDCVHGDDEAYCDDDMETSLMPDTAATVLPYGNTQQPQTSTLASDTTTRESSSAGAQDTTVYITIGVVLGVVLLISMVVAIILYKRFRASGSMKKTNEKRRKSSGIDSANRGVPNPTYIVPEGLDSESLYDELNESRMHRDQSLHDKAHRQQRELPLIQNGVRNEIPKGNADNINGEPYEKLANGTNQDQHGYQALVERGQNGNLGHESGHYKNSTIGRNGSQLPTGPQNTYLDLVDVDVTIKPEVQESGDEYLQPIKF